MRNWNILPRVANGPNGMYLRPVGYKAPALPSKAMNMSQLRPVTLENEDTNNPIDDLASNLGATRGFPADRVWRWLSKQAFTGKNYYENE